MANEYRVSQVAVEALADGQASARVSSFAVETLRSIAAVPSGGRRRQIVNN